MKVIKFVEATSTLKLRVDSFDDLYLLQRIVSAQDNISGSSYRRFKATEDDTGEQKEIFAKIALEKTELDKTAKKLRFAGKILEGRPEKYIRLGSYHTIGIGEGDVLEIQKQVWKDYILKRIRQAVLDTKKPKLGAIAVDDEKATVAYIKGYGIEIVTELTSHLSKRMKMADYEKAREEYFSAVIDAAKKMSVEIVVIAGPGFTKDDIKKRIEEKRIDIQKRLVYVSAGDAERSGIREALQSEEVTKVIENEHVKNEFSLLNVFLRGLSVKASFYGIDDVKQALESYKIAIVLVSDLLLSDKDVQDVLDIADKNKVSIQIFNANDEAGMQLSNFKGIAGIGKTLIS